MKLLYEEIARRFPEAIKVLGEDKEDMPYLVMTSIVEWLRTISPADQSATLIQRLINFQDWCDHQPRTDSAEDDVYTIYTVSFFEDLFKHEVTRNLIPHLAEKDDLLHSKDYLISWVGEENYEDVLRRYS